MRVRTNRYRIGNIERRKKMKKDMINKAYFFPDDEYCDAFFGSETPCCVDEEEVRRLADEWDMPFDKLMSQMHTASADEIREYGV